MAEVVSFEQVVQRGCGLDVHKQTVVATIDGVGLKRETREFGTTTRSLTELKEWLEQSGITHVAMESTGVYCKPVYHVLEPSGMTVWIINARHVKYVPGHKTDKVSMEDIEEVYHGKLKASKDEIYAACEGVVTKHHVFMLQRIKENILSCEGSIFKINSQIKSILFPYQNVLELLKAVPGMDTKSSEDLIAEIGLDMSVFPTEKHLASWCGVAPGNDESGSKKKVHASPTATSRSRR